MQYYNLTRHNDKTIIFSGRYNSFIECLEDAVTKNIDLSYIDLRNKNLTNAELDSARMKKASFTGANLSGANLSESILSGSVFYNASLYNTCMCHSNLNMCDFRDASFGGTLIEGSDIRESMFSTLSCFDLDFHNASDMYGCLFATPDGALHAMSRRPIVLRGLVNVPIIILDNTIKIDFRTFPKSILPKLMNMIKLQSMQSLSNLQNNAPIQKKPEKLA